VPFLCRLNDGVWQNAKTRRGMEATVKSGGGRQISVEP
jgi:hypothetical protein